jgi:hypothetical protein
MELSEYESARKDRIRKNREILSSLGLDKSQQQSAVPSMTAPQSRPRKRKQRPESVDDQFVEPRPKRITRSAVKAAGAGGEEPSFASDPLFTPTPDPIDRSQPFPMSNVVLRDGSRSTEDEVAHVRRLLSASSKNRGNDADDKSLPSAPGFASCESWEPGFRKIVKDRIYSLELYPSSSSCMVLVRGHGESILLTPLFLMTTDRIGWRQRWTRGALECSIESGAFVATAL